MKFPSCQGHLSSPQQRDVTAALLASPGPRIYGVNFVLPSGLCDSCLDELALEYLFPLPLLYNYVRLVRKNTHIHTKEEGSDEVMSCASEGGGGTDGQKEKGAFHKAVFQPRQRPLVAPSNEAVDES